MKDGEVFVGICNGGRLGSVDGSTLGCIVGQPNGKTNG